MSPELAVALGAVLGAPARYLLDRAVGRPPWGILAVNLLGSAAAGLVAGVAPSSALLAVGFLGSFTTASTLAWEVLESTRRGGTVLLALHVLPGTALAAAGFAVGRTF